MEVGLTRVGRYKRRTASALMLLERSAAPWLNAYALPQMHNGV